MAVYCILLLGILDDIYPDKYQDLYLSVMKATVLHHHNADRLKTGFGEPVIQVFLVTQTE